MNFKTLLFILIVLLGGLGVWLNPRPIKAPPARTDTGKMVVTPTVAPQDDKVKLTPETIKNSDIEIATVGPALLKMTLEFPGEIEFNKNNVAHVVPRVAGVVTEMRKNLGDRVKKNEIIAIIDSQNLAETKSQYIQAVHRLEFAQATFVREESLWKKKISAEQDYLTSKHQLEEAELSRQVGEQKLHSMGLSTEDLAALAIEPEGAVKDREVRTPFNRSLLTRYELRSPIDGKVMEKMASVGESVKEDAAIFIIADLSTVWGGISVYANDLGAVRVGQQVSVKTQASDMKAVGTISFLGSLVGAQTRTAKAYVNIPNPKELWRPGLFITVEVIREEAKAKMAVPLDAIQTQQNRSVVFVQKNGQFEARPVELGRKDGKWVEILSGLSPGEEYVSKNSFALKAELGKSREN